LKERLKKIRKTLDITQQEFADRIGIKRNSYANYEIGRNIPIDAIILSICREFNVNEDWLRTGAGGDENMFVKLSEDEELAMYTQMLLDSTDDVVADMIKETIVIYEKLDNDSKQALKNVARKLLDKMNGK
jgi:transcriptional regulator with XRE-family HTH domain